MIGLNVLEFADLQRISGYQRRADVERWAADIGLPFKRCRDGIWSTVDALNRAIGVAVVDVPLYGADVV